MRPSSGRSDRWRQRRDAGRCRAPLDGSIATRPEAALRLLHALTGRASGPTADDLMAQQRSRLGLVFRGLDGRRAGYSYHMIAEALFGHAGIPNGMGHANPDGECASQ
jgi:hypothetical protein